MFVKSNQIVWSANCDKNIQCYVWQAILTKITFLSDCSYSKPLGIKYILWNVCVYGDYHKSSLLVYSVRFDIEIHVFKVVRFGVHVTVAEIEAR